MILIRVFRIATKSGVSVPRSLKLREKTENNARASYLRSIYKAPQFEVDVRNVEDIAYQYPPIVLS
jgi:hypothetical protein